MTFTVMARCPQSGKFGIATSTSLPGVGGRVPHICANRGAVSIMAVTDRRLGDTALALLNLGYKAPGVIAGVVDSDPYSEYRQLGVIDADGNVAARTGANNEDWCGHHIRENFLALGNGLVGKQVIDAMEDSFFGSKGITFEERLVRALEGGRDAGGEPGGQQSAAILVYAERTYPYVDYRVDDHAEPIGELRKIWNNCTGAVDYFWQRQFDPRISSMKEFIEAKGL